MAMVTANAGGLIRTLAKLENDRATKNIKEPEFEMHYPVSLQVLIVIAAVIFAVLAGIGILAVDEEEGKIVCGAFFGLMCLVSLISTVFYRHWRLKFDKYGFVYTPGFGSPREFRYGEILSVKETGGSLLLKTEDVSIRIASFTIGLNVFLWKLKIERFEVGGKS